MKLSGPWQRLSEKVDLSGLQLNVPCHFYAAKDNIWSPRGQWDIYVWNTNNGAPSRPLARLCLGDPNTVNLEVSGGANGGVVLTVPPEYKISAVHGGGIRICKWEIRTILDAILIRNNSNQVIGTQGDSDVFQFEGTAGDVVRVGVEDDPQSGNNGGQARLRLSGSGINKEQTGTLPMEIVTQLAATGRYEITVEQANENPFRGPYIVWVSSHMGRIRALVPTDSVEE
jgi:hypothetical protein